MDEIRESADLPRPESVNQLLADLRDPMAPARRLIEIIWDDYAKRGQWPIFQYVEALLHRAPDHADALRTLLACPWVPRAHGLAYYGWFWVTDNRLSGPYPDDVVGLTIVGMSRLLEVRRRQVAMAEVQMFLTTLQALVSTERSFEPSPTDVQPVELTAATLSPFLAQGGAPSFMENAVSRLGEIVRHEPSTSGYIHSRDRHDWSLNPTSEIRRYEGVRTLDDYAEVLVAQIAPLSPTAPLTFESSLAVPEALDYLNAIWREKAGEALFGIRRAEAAAKMAAECTSADQLESRLSAVGELLYHLKLPGGTGEHRLLDLEAYLQRELPPEAGARAGAAVEDLRAVVALRTWRQHSGGNAEKAALRAMRRIRVQLPTSDWGAAWRIIQSVVVAALNQVREEVEQAQTLQEALNSTSKPDPAP